MIIANHKPIVVIGYTKGSITQEVVDGVTRHQPCEVVEPEDFLAMPNKNDYQYIVSDWMERSKKLVVIDVLDQQNLDLVTVIHDTVVMGNDPPPVIQPGTFIGAFCHIGLGSQIGRHCILSPYCQLGHYSRLGNNCNLRPGAIVVNKSTVGNHCFLDARVTVANKVTVCDYVDLGPICNVFKSIDQPGRYVGSPPRKVKSNQMRTLLPKTV